MHIYLNKRKIKKTKFEKKNGKLLSEKIEAIFYYAVTSLY